RSRRGRGHQPRTGSTEGRAAPRMTEREVLDIRTPCEWEDWLSRNHDEASEIWLRLFNKNAPEPGMSYGEAVEVALCFGWIDSMARKYDEVSRVQRFSRRKPRSPWSASNVERVQRLIEAGRMRDSGLHQIEAAKADGRWPGT
ncbi:MAG TPA: hypothetical protein VJ777_03495, partial [Mycobacterium sp.]|nr:hypothetical protein [Mycobacterium sp.]